MKKMLKRLCTGFLALATVVTALPTTPVHAESKQYWTESAERVGIIEKVMNDGSIGSTFNEGYMKVEGETAYCIDINTDFKNGYKTRADASSRMSADQISDVALSLEYVKQYGEAHKELNYKQVYLLEQCVVWQRLSVHLGWQCDNVRASYDEIPKATQDEVFSGAKAFVKENKGRYECGGYIYSGEGQELGQFWAKLNVGNAKLQKTSSNTSITNGNGNYSISGATYGVFSDKDCTKQLATLTTDENGNTDVVEVKAGTVYIKELSAPAGYKVDKTVYSLKVEAGKTATLKVSDTPKVTDTLIELFKIDMETQKDNPQGNASLAGAEFTWKYYAGFYNKDNLPAEATRTWVTKTIAETDSNGTTHYTTKLADAYKVSGDSFYMQDGKAVLPLGTLTVEETKAPNGYLLDGAYMQAGDKSEQIKGLYVTQITEDGDLAVLSGSNQFSVSDKVIRGGVKIQKRDLETGDTKPQGSATLKDTAFDIISLNDNAVLVEGKLYKKNEVVKTIHTDLEGVASTSADLLPYGKFRIVESEAPDGYLTDGAKPIDFTITENGKIVDLTDEAHSIYNQIKRGDIEGVKIGAGTHKRLADVPFRITSKTTGESHVVVTDDNGQFSTSADWASHKHNTNAGKTSEDGVWFGTSEPDDSKGALPYDTYIIEEMRCDSNKGFELIPPFEIVVSRNNLVIDLGTLTDEYEKEISIHTTATSKDGEKTILAGKEVTIVDAVKLDGLTKGTKYQLVLFIIFAMFLPISFLLSMIPSYESMAKQAIVRVFNTIMTRAGITLIVTVAFSISSMFYNISTDYPFFMVAFLQIVCFAGIYMKLGDLMSMFSLNAGDSQSMGRRIFRRPYLFMRHRARRMEHRIARAVSAGGISGGVAGAVAGSAVANKRAKRKNNVPKENRGNTTSSMGLRAGSKVGAVLDTKNKVKDKANAVKENIKDMPTQTAYAVYSAKEKAKSSVSDFKRGMVQEQQSRQTGRLEKQEQHKKNIADKRMELQKAQEARQAQRKADGSATTGATHPHERPATASKPSAEKMQEVKRPATATTSKASEPVKTNVIKERPLSSGVSDRKATQPAQTVHRQNVEKVVSQETRQNYTKDRRTKVQQTQNVQKNQQTTEKTRNLVTKKGQKKK